MRKTIALAVAGLMAATATTFIAAPAQAATPAPTVVSIRAELGFTDGTGYRIFEANNVVAGPGIELTHLNETANPEHWCGTVQVDVNPVAKTVSLARDPFDEACNFEVVRLTVTSPMFTTVSPVYDTLLEPSSDPDNAVTKTLTVSKGTIAAQWQVANENSLNIVGAALFHYTTAFSPTKALKITGTAKSGKKLHVTNVVKSNFSPRPNKIKIQWYRGSKKIKHATRTTYKVTKADKGRTLKAKVKVYLPGVKTKTFTVKKKVKR